MGIRTLTLVAALTTTLPAIAMADAMEDAIDARQGYYQMVKHNAGMLFAMAQGKMDYDAKSASTHAGNLSALANLDTGSMWPEGSDKASMPGKTRALPVIWETFPAIMDKQGDFVKAADMLAANAGNGLDALRANIGPLGASCKGCHDTYRAKEF